ncbi:ComEA family DNA-binding protein [Streptomyces sp. NPDC052051]|uniref:ComEA family DNA-binding protein n=1 Tax=Streptomyces sp. NPDC052051 TaxID=3154649 RepID=UPI00343DA7DC
MALRSRTHVSTAALTSGPGRAPGSDGRARHRLRHARGRARRHERAPTADALRLRAEALFAPGVKEWRESGNGPPLAVGGAVPVPGAAGAVWEERVGPAVRERLPLWLQARCGLERKSVVALSALLVLAAVLAVQHFWAGRTEQVRAPEEVRAAAPHEVREAGRRAEPGDATGARSQAGSGVVAGGAGVGGAAAGGAVVVDVTGKVGKPGLLTLPAGSRVADALLAAGGVRPGTDTTGLNRARLLVDGEQIVVGGPAPAPGPASPVVSGAAPAGPVSLSTATVEQLNALPGVGPVLAQHIVDYRTQHGGFRSVDDLRSVNGIGERRFADLRNLVRP